MNQISSPRPGPIEPSPRSSSPSAVAGSGVNAVALRGASLAFEKDKQKPAVPPKQPDFRDNGALIAATSTTSRSRPQSGVTNAPTGSLAPYNGGTWGSGQLGALSLGAVPGFGGVTEQSTGESVSSTSLAPPRILTNTQIDMKSPSLIAATLAASRSTSPSPSSNSRATWYAQRRDQSLNSRVPDREAVDSTSVAPTGSLIQMFEGTGSALRGGFRNGPLPSSRVHTAASERKVSVESSETSTGTDELSKLPPPEYVNGRPIRMEVRNNEDDEKDKEDEDKDEEETILPSRQNTIKARPLPLRRSSPSPKAGPLLSVQDIVAEAVMTNKAPPKPASKPPELAEKPQFKPKPSVKAKPIEPKAVPQEQRPRSPGSISYRKPRPQPKLRPVTPPPVIHSSTPEIISPRPTRPVNPVLEATTAPHVNLRAPRRTPESSPEPVKKTARKVKQVPPTPPQPRSTLKPVSQSFVNRRSPSPKAAQRPNALSSEDTSMSATSTRWSEREAYHNPPARRPSSPSLPGRRLSLISAPASPSRTPRLRPQGHHISRQSIDNLANAIVASSLASSRLTPQHTGTSIPPPALPPRQKSPRFMKTLRQHEEPVETDTERHKRGHLGRLQKGKHAHHEGSRKKWRDEITERERKRYEAIWQSNRGMFVTLQLAASASNTGTRPEKARLRADPSEYVSNIVVREIWRRSRLPDDELAEVWDVVDREGKGVLHRVEFVVGMWLIDQRLKGRKIPQKVGESVWSSGNGLKMGKREW